MTSVGFDGCDLLEQIFIKKLSEIKHDRLVVVCRDPCFDAMLLLTRLTTAGRLEKPSCRAGGWLQIDC